MNKLKDKVELMAEKLGLDLNFNSDEDLKNCRCGEPLKFGELKQMKDGEIVWATYKEDGSSRFRINGAYRIEKENNYWVLNDGSCGGADFQPRRDLDDNKQCFDQSCGEGEMLLWKIKQLQ